MHSLLKVIAVCTVDLRRHSCWQQCTIGAAAYCTAQLTLVTLGVQDRGIETQTKAGNRYDKQGNSIRSTGQTKKGFLEMSTGQARKSAFWKKVAILAYCGRLASWAVASCQKLFLAPRGTDHRKPA